MPICAVLELSISTRLRRRGHGSGLHICYPTKYFKRGCNNWSGVPFVRITSTGPSGRRTSMAPSPSTLQQT